MQGPKARSWCHRVSSGRRSGCPVELAHTWGTPDSSGGVLAGEEGDEFLALTAGTLMSKQAITVRPDATIAGAARMMNTHGIGRLPVVDSKGKLAGIVSRHDLLSVFLRPDADIAHDVGQLLEELALVDPMGIVVRVRQYGLACCRLVGSLADECEAHAAGARRPADHDQVASARTAGPARDTGTMLASKHHGSHGYHPLPMVPVSRLYAVLSASRSIAG